MVGHYRLTAGTKGPMCSRSSRCVITEKCRCRRCASVQKTVRRAEKFRSYHEQDDRDGQSNLRWFSDPANDVLGKTSSCALAGAKKKLEAGHGETRK